MSPVEKYISWLEAMAPELKDTYAFMIGVLMPGISIDKEAAARSFATEIRRLANNPIHTAGLALCLTALTDEVLRKRGAAGGAPEALRRRNDFIDAARSSGYTALAETVEHNVDQILLQAKREQKAAEDWAALRGADLSPDGIDGWLKESMRQRHER